MVVETEMDSPLSADAERPISAAQRVYRGIMQDLEHRRIAPGQRLVEIDLAAQFGVGRNAVREAMQQLAARGVVDLSRHRSGAIRKLDLAETLEILEVAEGVTAIMCRAAARGFKEELHGTVLSQAMSDLSDFDATQDPATFSRARRRLYRALLEIGGNRELQRIFPAVGMHIIYSQYQSPLLRQIRLDDYQKISAAVVARDVAAAEQAGSQHVDRVRTVVTGLAQNLVGDL